LFSKKGFQGGMATHVRSKPRDHASAQASATNTITYKIDGFKIQEDGDRLKIHLVRKTSFV
jgi:hypothetical protein